MLEIANTGVFAETWWIHLNDDGTVDSGPTDNPIPRTVDGGEVVILRVSPAIAVSTSAL